MARNEMHFYGAANHRTERYYIFTQEPNFQDEGIQILFSTGGLYELPEKNIPEILRHENEWKEAWFGKYYEPQPKKRKRRSRPLTTKLGELVNLETVCQNI